MRKGILAVGVIVLIVGIVFIPTSRLISENRTTWDYNEKRYGYLQQNQLPEGLIFELYLNTSQRWTVKLLEYGQETNATIDEHKPYIQVYDYSDTLIYDVPYETLRIMPHGWEPVPIEGWYKIDINWKPSTNILLSSGFGVNIGTFVERIETVYPYGELFSVGLFLVVIGAVIGIVGALTSPKTR
jgi:hypothetical protein